jgi:multiple sugar transport system permease protein
MKTRTVKKVKKMILYVLAILLIIIITLPALWVVLSSFRPRKDILAKPAVWVPRNMSIKSYRMLFSHAKKGEMSVPVSEYFRNSIIISLSSTIVAVGIGMLGGYAFSRFRFRGKNTLFLLIMLSRTIPGIALSLPLLIFYSYTNLIDTKIGIVIVYVALNVPFAVWLTDGFFREIPTELSESAQIDGCSRWQAFWKIDFPLAGPGIGASGIFAFLIAWNEFAIANVLTRTLRSKTMPVGLFDFVFEFVMDWRGMCTLAVIMLIPAVIITFIIQKNLVKGLTFGALKG